MYFYEIKCCFYTQNDKIQIKSFRKEHYRLKILNTLENYWKKLKSYALEKEHCQLKKNLIFFDIGEWSPFAIYQQRCRSGNWIYRIQYTLPNNNILT
jgi:hypothetical protein